MEWPLLVDARGTTFCTPRGRIGFGWEAVTKVSFVRIRRSQLLQVRLHIRTPARAARGSAAHSRAGGWKYVRRAGLRLSLRTVRCEPNQLAQAITHFSGGRFTPQPFADPIHRKVPAGRRR